MTARTQPHSLDLRNGTRRSGSEPSGNHRRVLRLPEVLVRVAVSRSTLYAQQAIGMFPPAIQLGARAVGWLEFEVEAVLAARAAGALEEQVRALVTSLVAERQRRSTTNAAEVG